MSVEPKRVGCFTPKSSIKKIGFSMKSTIHFGGVFPYFWFNTHCICWMVIHSTSSISDFVVEVLVDQEMFASFFFMFQP